MIEPKVSVDFYSMVWLYLMFDVTYSILQPSKRLAYGSLKWLIVSAKEGLLKQIDEASLQEILSLESYRSHQFFVDKGDSVKKTQNCFSWGGAVTLANTDEKALNRDYARYVLALSCQSILIVLLTIMFSFCSYDDADKCNMPS